MKRLLCLAMLGFVFACGGNTAENAPPATPATPAAEHHDDHHHGKPASGGPVKAPGEEFVVEATSPKVEHGGKTYYLCCGGCKKKFEENPAKFLNQS